MKSFRTLKAGATVYMILIVLISLLSFVSKAQEIPEESMNEIDLDFRQAFRLHQISDFITYAQKMVEQDQKESRIQIGDREYKVKVTGFEKPITVYRQGVEQTVFRKDYLIQFQAKSREYKVRIQDFKIEFNSENLPFFGVYNMKSGEITLKSRFRSSEFRMVGYTYEFSKDGLGGKVEDWVILME